MCNHHRLDGGIGWSVVPAEMWMVQVGQKPMKKPLPRQGSSFKAGEAIRTPDIHVADVLSANLESGFAVSPWG